MYMWSCERYTEIYTHKHTIHILTLRNCEDHSCSKKKHEVPLKTHTSFLAPHTGLAYSRSLINTDWMNAEVEWRDLEAHRVISRNLKHAELMLFVLSPAWNFSSLIPPPFFLQVLGIFFSHLLSCFTLWNRSRFSGGFFWQWKNVCCRERKKNWRTIVIWYWGNLQI